MPKIALYDFLAICAFVNFICMLDFGHFVENIPGLPDLLSFHVILNWSNAAEY